MNKLLRSSANPEKLSLTIKGVLLALIPVAVFLLAKLGFDLTEVELLELANAFVVVVSAVLVFIGLMRKIIIKLKQ